MKQNSATQYQISLPEKFSKTQLKFMTPVGTLGFSKPKSESQQVAKLQVNWTAVLVVVVIVLGALLLQSKPKPQDNWLKPVEGSQTCSAC